MGTDADAVICFGIKFKTDFDFPWDDVDSDWDYDTRRYILAAHQTIVACSHYAPQEFDIEKLTEIDYPKIAEELIQFCQAYGIEYDSLPSWYLSSYFA